MTLPEVKLWTVMRSRPHGLRFRRQHPIGAFILDFYCPKARLAIEIDGIVHDMGDRPTMDQMRDRVLAEQGIETMRIAAADVLNHFEAVCTMILNRCVTAR